MWGHQFPNTEAHMPDQNTHVVINLGDVVTPDQMATLPIGAVVTAAIGDSYTRVAPDENGWAINNSRVPDWNPTEVADYFGPTTLTSLPPGASSTGQPDLFQQARIALRDRLGTEPSQELVEGTRRLMAAGVMGAEDAARTVVEAQSLGAKEIASTFLLVLVEGADASTQFVVADDSTAGLARLRAHAALDALLDQHGVSR